MDLTAEQLKELMKAAVLEVLDERRDTLEELVGDALKELGLIAAIKEGAESGRVSRRAAWE